MEAWPSEQALPAHRPRRATPARQPPRAGLACSIPFAPEPVVSRLGRVRIDPAVLHTIAQVTCRQVPGLAGLGAGEGIRVRVEPEGVRLQLDVLVHEGPNLLRVARELQAELKRAISDILGIPVKEIDVFIQDVIPREGG